MGEKENESVEEGSEAAGKHSAFEHGASSSSSAQQQQQHSSSSNNSSRRTNSNNSCSSGSSGGGSSRRKRASRRHRTARTRPGWINRCRFAGGRRFRPAKTRGYRAFPVPMAGGGFVWACCSGRKEGGLLVLDDDSARAIEFALSLLRGGGGPDETQVCSV